MNIIRRYPDVCLIMSPKFSLVQSQPLKRKVFWTSVPNATFQEVNCCLNGSSICATALSSVISCTGSSCLAQVDFETLVTVGTEKQQNMIAYADANYECTVTYKFPGGIETLKSNPAILVCGVDGAGAFAATTSGITQITGDPAADGWFKVGLSSQLGVYGKQKSNTAFEVYTTSFYLTQSIIDATSGYNKGNTKASLTLGSFQLGDRLIGVGIKWIDGQQGKNQGMFPKIDTDGKGFFRPSTSTATADGMVSGSSNCGTSTGLRNGKISSAVANPSNTNRAFSSFQVSCFPTKPFGADFLNTDGGDPNGAPFHTLLPMRAFGMTDASSQPQSFEMIFNDDALRRNSSLGVVNFENGWKFVLGAGNSDGDFTDTVGFTQPLACSSA